MEIWRNVTGDLHLWFPAHFSRPIYQVIIEISTIMKYKEFIMLKKIS